MFGLVKRATLDATVARLHREIESLMEDISDERIARNVALEKLGEAQLRVAHLEQEVGDHFRARLNAERQLKGAKPTESTSPPARKTKAAKRKAKQAR